MKTKPSQFLFIDANVADKQTLLGGIAANVNVVELNEACKRFVRGYKPRPASV